MKIEYLTYSVYTVYAVYLVSNIEFFYSLIEYLSSIKRDILIELNKIVAD